MESTKLSVLLLAMLALSSSPVAVVLACGSAGSGTACTTPSTATGITNPSAGLPELPIAAGGSPAVSAPHVLGAASPVIGAVPMDLGPLAPVVGAIAPVVGSIAPVIGSIAPAIGGIPAPPVLSAASPVLASVPAGLTTHAPVVGGGTVASPSRKTRHDGRKECPPSPPTPTPSPPTPTPTPPTPTPRPAPPSSKTCPIDALKLGVCLDILGNKAHIGDSHVKCCPLVQGVAGLTAAACLCTAIKAKGLDLSIYVPLALKLLVNDCGCAVPRGYTCA